jgi:hypothetical protein
MLKWIEINRAEEARMQKERLTVLVVLRYHHHAVSDEEGGVEADAELPDE